MKKERRDTLLAALYGTKAISEFCAEITLNLTRLLEFTEEERCARIINEIGEKTSEISKHCVAITAICKTVADGKSGIKNIGKVMDKMMLNGEIKIINKEEET